MRGFLICAGAVLAAIGIGIGAVSGAGTAELGPPGHRFVVAWPAPPQQIERRAGSARLWAYLARSDGSTFEVAVSRGVAGLSPGERRAFERAWCRPARSSTAVCAGWVAYSPPEVTRGSVEIEGRRVTVLYGPADVSGRGDAAGSFALATARVLGFRWTILAVGRAAEIRRFVASFTTAG